MSISIVIITNTKKLNVVNICIKSALDISDDVIVVGNVDSLKEHNVTLVDAADLAKVGEIGKMRNIGADLAKHDYVINCDDDIVFPLKFKKHFENFIRKNPDIDVFVTKVIGSNGGRYWDRPVFYDGDSWMIDYDAPYDNNLYYSGAFIVRKKEFASKYKWDENLGFYNNEDISYSNRIKSEGFSVNIDLNNHVIHFDDSYITYRNGEKKLVVDRKEFCNFKNEVYSEKLLREINATINYYKTK